MTNMKRTSVSLPDELVDRLAELKETDEYRGCTYSELIRRLIKAGLPCDTDQPEKDAS